VKKLTILAALLLAFAWQNANAQAAQPQAFSSDAAAERILNLDTLKAQLKQYHDCTCTCGCYTRDLDKQADRAIAFLRQRAAHRRPNEKLAMVLDIDETTLSNYEETIGADFANSDAAFDAWALEGRAPAIAGTLRLYKEAQRFSVDIFFITGRWESERAATERNLRAEGFDNWKQLVLRPSDKDTRTATVYKSLVREQLVAQGYTLVLNVGDQWSDLKGKPEAEFSVKYPNPFYIIR